MVDDSKEVVSSRHNRTHAQWTHRDCGGTGSNQSPSPEKGGRKLWAIVFTGEHTGNQECSALRAASSRGETYDLFLPGRQEQ